MRCTLNTYKAEVKWFKENKEISGDNYLEDKDIYGVCSLKIVHPSTLDAAKYSCKIIGREKEKNCYTKTEVVLEGTNG